MGDIWSRLGISFDEPIRDPLWGNVMLPGGFGGIMASPAFVKLSRILQLGPAQLVYPGATHTRRAHSIGVYEMARRILGAIGARNDLDWIKPAEARGFLVAALCHDVGHFPYAHSLKELPLREHESLTALELRGAMSKEVERAGADPDFAAAVVDEALPAPDRASERSLTLFRSLLSGVLDPDKLDYLNRDAWSCGVPYGLQDVDFALRHLGLDEAGRPGISERGAMAVESVLFSKYQMYRAVYWHKAVRAATSMIKRAVIDDLASGALEPGSLYGLDDPGFYALMSRDGRDRRGLIRSVFEGRLLSMAASFRFDLGSASQLRILELKDRPSVEAELERGSGAGCVVVDLPEPVSFESEMPILGTGLSFSAWSTAFGPEVVKAFAGSLRVIRVYSDPDSAEKVGRAAIGLFGRR